jgi:hypothetical protein
MKNMIENYINGNIATARKLARRFRLMMIHDALVFDFGFSQDKAIKTAHFLKTGEGWQEACDSV